MMCKRLGLGIGLVLLCLAPGACRPASPRGPGGLLQVTVSIPPQKYFLERLGGARVAVDVMVGPADAPETYEPRPAQLQSLSRSEAYFSAGVPFETAWLGRFATMNPGLRIMDTTQGIERMPLPAGHAHHDADADENVDPHTWLSPALVRLQAVTITASLADLRPEHAQEFRDNLRTFQAEIEALDRDIRAALAPVQGRAFMVFHPAWGYFARDYGLVMIPVETDGQEPSAAELAALIETARREKIRILFTQPTYGARAMETIARQMDGRVVELNDLAPAWADNLRHVARSLAEAMHDR